MNKTQKIETVNNLAENLENKHFYLTNSQGLTAQEVNHLRTDCFKNNIHYLVVKNTLLIKALQKLNNTQIDLKTLKEKSLKGPTSLFIIKENPSQPAKILQKFHKKYKLKIPTLKAAFVYDDLVIGENKLKTLTTLKSKEELIAQVIQLLQSPTNNLLSALQSAGTNLTSSLKTIIEKNKPN